MSSLRSSLLLLVALTGALGAACGKTATTPPKDPPPAPTPAPAPPSPSPPGGVPVTGNERIGWDQEIAPGTNIRDYHFAAFVDTRRTTLPDIRCETTAGPAGYACSAQLPLLTDGQHTLRIVASRVVDGAEPVSDRSAELVVVKGQVASTPSDDLVRSTPSAAGAEQISANRSIDAEIVATHLAPVNDLAALPDGRIVIAERSGVIRVIWDGLISTNPMAVLPRVAEDDGGLMSVTAHPGFARNHLLYLLYAADTAHGVMYRLARGREVDGVLGEFAVLGDLAQAERDGSGALRFGSDGKLYLLLSDLSTESLPGSTASFRGKVLRLTDAGRTPEDSPGASPIFSSGHKQAFGLASAPLDGRLFEAETARSGRINVLRPGARRLSEVDAAGERPLADLGPTARPGGIIVYSGRAFPHWRGNLLVARIDGEGITRVALDGTAAASPLVDLARGFGRIRSLVEAADGSLYFGTANRDAGAGQVSADDDRVVRLRPARITAPRVPGG